MSDLKGFLLARIAEDEAQHHPSKSSIECAECTAYQQIVETHTGWHVCPNHTDGGCTDYGDGSGDEWEEICPTLRILATIWSDNPDYREEWSA